MAKILFFISEDWYFWSHRLPIARAALKRGDEVTLITRVNEHGKRIQDEGFKLIPISLIRRSINPFRELMAVIELVKIYRKEQPDIVHHVALKPVLYGSWAAKITGINNVVNALAGLGYAFVASGLKGSVYRSLFGILLKPILARKNSKVIFQNPEDREILISRSLIKNHQAVIIKGSGVDCSQYIKNKEVDIKYDVIFASRMLWSKGAGDLVSATRLLLKQGVSCHVILVGRPDTDNPDAIPEADLIKWNNEGIISWLGHRNDINKLLQESRIAVFAS